MAIDRSKYRKASSEEMAQQTEEMKAREQTSDRATFLKVESGINKFRIFPAPVKAKSSLFCFPKVTSFLPLLVDEYDESGNKTGRQIEKRKAVFNAKVHGGLSIDIVESYIEAVKEKFASTTKDSKEVLNKLKPIVDWKTGIKPSSAWICYAYKYIKNGENKVYGRLQLTDGVKKQLDALCLREGDSGSPIVIDLFSGPDNGKPFQWTSNPNAEDPKAKNKVNILFEEELPLTDEELEMLESWDSLEDLYTHSYTKSDFEKQLKGLQRFDKKQNLNVFDSPSFQSIIEIAKEEVENLDKESSDSENESSNKKSTSNAESSIPDILQEMDKKTLMNLPGVLEIEVAFKNTTPPSKMRQLIKNAIVETYELEGNDEDINNSITEIIESAISNEEENNLTEDDNENSSVDEDNDNGENTDNTDENVNEDLTPPAPANKKRESLLQKYSNRKKQN